MTDITQDEAIIDANFEPQSVIIQNPDQPCPEEIISTLGLMQVKYYGFDNKIHAGQIIVATNVMSDVEAFFAHAFEIKFPIERVVPVSAPQYKWDGEKVINDNVSSGFDYRLIQEKNKKSYHSYGQAFDINPNQNPYILYKDGKSQNLTSDQSWDPSTPGTLHADHPLVKLMEGFGWEWGGHWTPESGRTDYQHFQKNV